MRIGKQRSAERYKILYAVLKLLFSLFGRTNKICGKNGNIDNLFHLGGKILTPATFKGCRLKPVIEGIISRRRNVNSVYALIGESLCDFQSLLQIVALALLTDFFIHFVNGKSYYNRKICAAFTPYAVDYFGKKAHTVFKASAVFIISLVCIRRQKLLNKISVSRV